MAKELKVDGRMKVGTLKKNFKEIFNVGIRVYKGQRFADEDATLASIRAESAKGGDIAIHGATKVGNVEKMFKDAMGIKIQIEDKAGELADNDLTLSKVGEEKTEPHTTGEPDTKKSPDKEKKGCFIATATLGSASHPYCENLRQFRDRILINGKKGDLFILQYYRWSPSFAGLIERSDFLRCISYYLVIKPSVFIAKLALKKGENKKTFL